MHDGFGSPYVGTAVGEGTVDPSEVCDDPMEACPLGCGVAGLGNDLSLDFSLIFRRVGLGSTSAAASGLVAAAALLLRFLFGASSAFSFPLTGATAAAAMGAAAPPAAAASMGVAASPAAAAAMVRQPHERQRPR